MTRAKCCLPGQTGTLDSPGLPGTSAPASQKQGRGADPAGWGGDTAGRQHQEPHPDGRPGPAFPQACPGTVRPALWTLWDAPLEQVSYRTREERTAAFVGTACGAFTLLPLV